MGQSFASSVETQSYPAGLTVVDVTFQKSIRYLLFLKFWTLSATQWLKKVIPGLVVSFALRLSPRSSQRQDELVKLRTLSMRQTSVMGCSAASSKPEVTQVKIYNPRQVPQTGKILPFLFSLIANWTIKYAFLTHLLSLWISSSPAPPVKRTPLTFLRAISRSACSEKAQRGTTWAPDIQTYLTQAADIQVLRNSLVEGQSYQSIWVQTPMTGVCCTMARQIDIRARRIRICIS